MNDIRTRILHLSIEHWNKKFCGISGLDIAERLSEPHEKVLSALEDMEAKGAGTLRREVTLHILKINFNSDIPTSSVSSDPEVTHIFFPSPLILKEHFYSTDLARSSTPEYKTRLHHGGNQIALLYFSPEVFARYLSRPDLFEIYDTQAGGHINTKSNVEDSQYLYVRYGKRLRENGSTTITAILKDLANMSPEKQRHWHSHEINSDNFKEEDPEFTTFKGW